MIATAMVAALGGTAAAADMPEKVATTYKVQGDYEDVRFALENAIVNRGLVVDYVSHVGEMLTRTGADVGAKKDIYANATTMLFCSAVLSRAAMEADPANIAFCPYGVFAYETADNPGTVIVGYRNLTATGDEASKKAIADVNAMLDEIVKEATE